MTTSTVAATILDQLGGRRFVAMTGAKHLTGSATTLTFQLPGTPGFVRQRINGVCITLTPADTYTVEFCRLTRHGHQILVTLTDVYAEDLQAAFTRETGLATHL